MHTPSTTITFKWKVYHFSHFTGSGRMVILPGFHKYKSHFFIYFSPSTEWAILYWRFWYNFKPATLSLEKKGNG